MELGVLGLQGDYAAHGAMLDRLGATWHVVKKPSQLDGIDGLVMPGGESTTLIKLMDSSGLWKAIADYAALGKPIFGTCAGMILVAKDVINPAQRSLGLIDIGVERNGYGRQIDSAEVGGIFETLREIARWIWCLFARRGLRGWGTGSRRWLNVEATWLWHDKTGWWLLRFIQSSRMI